MILYHIDFVSYNFFESYIKIRLVLREMLNFCLHQTQSLSQAFHKPHSVTCFHEYNQCCNTLYVYYKHEGQISTQIDASWNVHLGVFASIANKVSESREKIKNWCGFLYFYSDITAHNITYLVWSPYPWKITSNN